MNALYINIGSVGYKSARNHNKMNCIFIKIMYVRKLGR